MKKTFIRTKNVKQFVSLMDELQKVPPNIPKMALVYGEHGLGKSQTIQWWADKNDSVYVRATQGMTSRWLLSEIAEELGEEAFYHSQETFTLIENNLRQNNKVIIVDEVDYLIDKSIIETLRDLHDKTGCPVVLVGMGAVDKKLARYPHLMDWEYVAVLDNRTRPEHAQLHGLIYRYDDPFWASFYPPNGWRCRCRVNALSDYNLKKKDAKPGNSTGTLSQEMRLVSKKSGEYKPVTVYTDPLTGKKIAPDVGWSHNPASGLNDI